MQNKMPPELPPIPWSSCYTPDKLVRVGDPSNPPERDTKDCESHTRLSAMVFVMVVAAAMAGPAIMQAKRTLRRIEGMAEGRQGVVD